MLYNDPMLWIPFQEKLAVAIPAAIKGMGLREGAALGAGLGALHAATDTDEEGRRRSLLGGAARGAILGGAGGALAAPMLR